ncbi:MAG: NAD-dependent epimerase/dehydratase family protein [Planctomycetota bacterium]
MSDGGPIYFVTGGAGFVGANLVAELMRRDSSAEIHVIDDFRSGSFANIVEACARAGVGPFRGSVVPESTAELNLANAVEMLRPAAVFHLGAITDTTLADEAEMIRVNTEGFEDLIDACADTRTPLVYASSAATYGTPPQTTSREAFPIDAAGEPNNVYGFSKWLMETIHRRVIDRRAATGDPAPICVGLRYFNVFGPGESRKGKMASMVYQLAQQMLDGHSPRLFTGGEQSRDQVPVEDVVSCTLAAAGFGETPIESITPGVYNLGSGVATSFNEIVSALREALGLDEATQPTEYFEMPAHIRAFYQDWTLAKMSETERGLGWTPGVETRAAMVAYGKLLASECGTVAAGV